MHGAWHKYLTPMWFWGNCNVSNETSIRGVRYLRGIFKYLKCHCWHWSCTRIPRSWCTTLPCDDKQQQRLLAFLHHCTEINYFRQLINDASVINTMNSRIDYRRGLQLYPRENKKQVYSLFQSWGRLSWPPKNYMDRLAIPAIRRHWTNAGLMLFRCLLFAGIPMVFFTKLEQTTAVVAPWRGGAGL